MNEIMQQAIDQAFQSQSWHLAAIKTGIYMAHTDVSTPEKYVAAQATAICNILTENQDLKEKLRKASAIIDELNFKLAQKENT